MTTAHRKSLMTLALLLIFALVLATSISSAAEVLADDTQQQELVTPNSPEDLERQRDFDENKERWKVPNEEAESVLERYRSQLERIPGAENVTYGLDPDEQKMFILVQTPEEPTREALDAAPKTLDGLEVRVEKVPTGDGLVGFFAVERNPKGSWAAVDVPAANNTASNR
jgi:hypothetical protein